MLKYNWHLNHRQSKSYKSEIIKCEKILEIYSLSGG